MQKEVREELLRNLRDGVPKKQALKIAGMGDSDMKSQAKKDTSLEREMEQAEAHFVRILVAKIMSSASGWQRWAWLLERKHPELFGLQPNLRISGNKGKYMKIEISHIPRPGKKLDEV